MPENTLSVEEVAARLRVSDKTVRRMIARGAFPGAYRNDPTNSKSRYRVPESAVAAVEALRAQGQEITDEA